MSLPKDGEYLVNSGAGFETRTIVLTGLQRLLFMVWHDEIAKRTNYDFDASADQDADWDTLLASADEMLFKVMDQDEVCEGDVKLITPKTYASGTQELLTVDWSTQDISVVEIDAVLQQTSGTNEVPLQIELGGAFSSVFSWSHVHISSSGVSVADGGLGYEFDRVLIPSASYDLPTKLRIRLANIDADQNGTEKMWLSMDYQRLTGSGFGYKGWFEGYNQSVGGASSFSLKLPLGRVWSAASWIIARGW